MGAIRTSATALVSVGAAGAALAFGVLGAPAATAVDPPVTSFGFGISPPTVAPGGLLTLSVTGCEAASAVASSGVFDTVAIERDKTVRVRVDRDARPGAVYYANFTCGGETASTELRIAGGSAPPETSSTTGSSPRPSKPAVPATPRAPAPATPTAPAPATAPASAVAPASSRGATLGVRGGIGGSVAGLDAAELGAGAALVAAAAGGTAYALRRRAARRGH
ncbi:hypothetical protein [Streptomyces sp. NPDC091268]|uniref:hypothetical protein n=1 Tax=Streptomyces sp. NPDC091268 TaxID=3365979 RepID=UPI00381BCECF